MQPAQNRPKLVLCEALKGKHTSDLSSHRLSYLLPLQYRLLKRSNAHGASSIAWRTSFAHSELQ